MSKNPKVEMVAQEGEGKAVFENAPRLFSKWEYETINVIDEINSDHRPMLHGLHRLQNLKIQGLHSTHRWPLPSQEVPQGALSHR